MRDDPEPPFEPDPVIDAFKPGVDVSLLIENLNRTHEERFRTLESMARLVEAARCGREGRLPPDELRAATCV